HDHRNTPSRVYAAGGILRTGSAGSGKTGLSPAGLEGYVHQRLRPLVTEHPRSAHPRVGFVIDAGAPHRPVFGCDRTGPEQVPLRSRRIAVHLDLTVQAVVDGKGEDPRCAAEEVSDRLASLEPAEARAFPQRIFGE